MDPSSWATIISSGVAAVALFMAFAAYATGPGQVQNRSLAVLLFLEGVLVFSVGASRTVAPELTQGLLGVGLVCIAAIPWVYLILLSTLDTPLMAPLRMRRMRWGLALIGLAAGLSVLLVADPAAGYGTVVFIFMVSVSLLAVIVAYDAFRRAPQGSIRRTSAKAFFLAFGLRDLLWVLFAFYVLLLASRVSTDVRGSAYVEAVPAGITLLYMVILTYGILRTQLFDIDLRIKRSLVRTVLISSFVLIFVAASELAEVFFFEGSATTSAGVGAAIVLGLAFRPLERGARRIVDMVMPHVDDPDRLQVRKTEVYQAAFEGAYGDGRLTVRERRMMAALRDKLGLDEETVARLEASIQGVPSAERSR